MRRYLLTVLLVFSVVGISVAQNTGKSLKIQFFCPKWGAESLSWEDFCKKVKDAGYDGVEAPFPAEETERKKAIDALTKYELLYVGMIFYNPASQAHLKDYEQQIRTVATMKPVFINSHTGKDFTTFEQNKAVIDVADKVSKEIGVKIIHETHRGRFSYAANITKTYLDKIPSLRLTLDISHWCAVHESYLDDQSDAIQTVLERTDHIHSRVGHPEGPQVSDPRAPEWKTALDKHLAWWDKVVALHKQKGTPLTVTTEFGPPGYLPTLPFTNQPVTSQWDVNVYMMQLLKQRYQ